MKDVQIYRDNDGKINGIGFSQTLLDMKKPLPIQIYLNEREICSNINNEYQEPLIKDDKIRKAIRAWAEVLCTNKVHVAQYDCMTVFRDEQTGYRLEIVTDDIQHGLYTITELCGDEEDE